MIMILSAMASAILIVLIGNDAYRGHTAIGNRHIYRHRTPSLYWVAIMWYLAGVVLILAGGVYELASSGTERADCPPDHNENCVTLVVELPT